MQEKFPSSASLHPINKERNRYTNIAAFDHSRVVLKGTLNSEGTDYVNANFIQGFTSAKQYIAAQGYDKKYRGLLLSMPSAIITKCY
jgi:protein tyrosine phosphatase